jgi:uncharacterized repeat protein (TIGR03843 family)
VKVNAEADVLALLERADLEILGLLPRSSNYTFLAKATDGDAQALVVYKPRAGEAPLWDFPRGTLCRREVAAYLVAHALGWPLVPPTILRDGPEGPGSVQLFLEFDPDAHYFTMVEERPDEFRRIALFDAAVNNADRKAGHCLRANDGRVFVIDHGVCFHEEPKLRTVVWDFVDEPVPDDLALDLARLRDRLRGEVAVRLEELLTDREVDATLERLDTLLGTRRFPRPGTERSYPWPVL